MALNTIFSDSLDKYKPVIWYGKAVYKYVGQLKSFISSQIGAEYATIFAETFIYDSANTGVKKIRWMSADLSANAKKITELSESEQVVAKAKLKEKLLVISNFAAELIESKQKDAIKWGEIINKAIETPSLGHVFFDGNNILLTAWGFSTVEAEQTNFRLKKEVLGKKPINNIAPPPVNNDDNDELVESDEKKNDAPIVEDSNEPVIKNEPEVKNETIDNQEEKQEEKEETPPPEEEKKILLKKWWFWAIIAGVLLVLLWLILFCCKGINPNLPKDEGDIPPIDTTNIVDDDNGRPVISNQLILYIGSKDKTVEQLADDFKELYPGNEYQIIYYNTQGAKRINIEFPEAEKEQIKKELKEKLKDYNLVIVDEAIFNNEMVPPDPGFSDSKKNWSYEAVKVYPAWDVTKGNPDIIVAIIDDGFDMNHPEFQGKIVSPFNMPEGTTKPNTGAVGMFHGTHVASTAIGNMDNSQGLCGIAPKCGFMPIQVGDRNGNMSTTAIIDAIFYAIDNGADVVNMSLGMPALPGMSNISQEAQLEFIENIYKDDEELWNQIFTVADENNVTFVLAGGNDNVMIGLDPMQRHPNTIKVSALNPKIRRAEFSNYGKFSTISAPGVEIWSALPDGKFGFLQGTSMASPMVTGGVALLKSKNPSLTTEEIIKILQETGLEVNEPDKYVGNLMQLSEALGATDDIPDDGDVDCPDIQKKIDSLQNEIDKLRDICKGGDSSSHELIIPDDPKDFTFAMGLWKSTSDLHNTLNKKSVELYFQFNRDGSGEIKYLEEDGNNCYADLTLSLEKNTLNFVQIGEAPCDNADKYMVHKFTCVSEDNNVANCVARTEDGDKLVEFTLVKIK